MKVVEVGPGEPLVEVEDHVRHIIPTAEVPWLKDISHGTKPGKETE